MCKHDRTNSNNSADSNAPVKSGWVIEGRRADSGESTHRFLQIGTGQWCPQQYATVFPLKETAIVYAHEFGYSVGHNANVVRYCGCG